MIRAPRHPLAPCGCGGTCKSCTDDLVVFWRNPPRDDWRTADLATNVGRRMVAVGSLAAHVPLNEPRREVLPVDVARFEAHMSALHERLELGRG